MREAGHDAVHVGDRALLGAVDSRVMQLAVTEKRVVVSADTDFGELLALGRRPGTSVVLFRRAPRRPEAQVRLLVDALPALEPHLRAGAIAVLMPGAVRVRQLPGDADR